MTHMKKYAVVHDGGTRGDNAFDCLSCIFKIGDDGVCLDDLKMDYLKMIYDSDRSFDDCVAEAQLIKGAWILDAAGKTAVEAVYSEGYPRDDNECYCMNHAAKCVAKKLKIGEIK